jgi:hypothetical protein
VAELPTQGLPPVCASTLAYNERASNKTPNSVTTSALAEAGSHDLQTQTSDWLDQDQLAARLAWDRSDESPVAKETEATAPAETLVNHDFDLPSLEDDTSQSDEPTVTTESSPVGRPVLVEPVEASWPSTRFILHSQAVHAAIAKRRQAMASAEKIGLTIPQPPRNYRFGNRTILSGVLLIVGAASAVAVGLTYRMCADGTTAATYDGLLGAEILPRRELTELAQEPIAPWWSTSRNSLALRAAALARSDDPAAVEVVTQVIDRAVAVCPLDPVAALERRRVFSANSEESFSPFQPAREVSSLAFAAELHLKQGHRRRASELLRDGFQIASTGQIELTALSSNEAEERGGLLPLPHEKLCEPLVAVMKAYDLLTREACDNILPPWAPAWLAAARSARQSSQREAQAIVDKLEELPAEYDDMGGTWVQEAAIAEGMVMKGDLQSSAERYRRAIERCGKSAWAGLLWLNLAEVEARRYDTEAAEHAQRMARKAASYGGPEAKIIKRLLRDTHEHRRPATPG